MIEELIIGTKYLIKRSVNSIKEENYLFAKAILIASIPFLFFLYFFSNPLGLFLGFFLMIAYLVGHFIKLERDESYEVK